MPDTAFQPWPDAQSGDLTELGKIADATGKAMLTLTGLLDQIDRDRQDKTVELSDLQNQTAQLLTSSRQMTSGLATVQAASTAAQEAMAASIDTLQATSADSKAVAHWVGALDEKLSSVQDVLAHVRTANHLIAKISKQINILAVNARIEASRAGDLGKGFAVVANAINDLAKETTNASSGVTDATVELTDLMGAMRQDATSMAEKADHVLSGSASADEAIGKIDMQIRDTARTTDALSQEARTVSDAVEQITPLVDATIAHLHQSGDGIAEARDRGEGIVDTSERAVQLAFRLGGANRDADLIDLVQRKAAEIGARFEAAIAEGRITSANLFDMRYTPIAGSDPEQVMAPFTNLTDALLPDLLEDVTGGDARIVFCAAVDRNGYLPTHNVAFSKPQSDDPVWNAANCRNRRIFNDRVGLKAGQNAESFLMQTYRRDMGGGTFALMKDLSAPIFVSGRHWGGFRIGFKPRA